MSRAKQVCVGVAAAGIFGLGSSVATAVSYAEPGHSEAGPSSSAAKAGSPSAGPRARTRPHTQTRHPVGAITRPAVSRASVSAARKPAAAGRTSKKTAAELISLTLSTLGVAPVTSPGATSSTASPATGRSRRGAVVTATAVAAAGGGASVSAQASTPTHVLVIGIDGTNLSAILADDANVNLLGLMNTGTTAVSTIVGHTTISNPSWTGILTGVWGETAGVINNVFTPWTYDKWPTIFNQLETYDPAIETTAIADWANIAQIAGAGSAPADNILYYEKYNNSWLDTDDLVGQASVDAIEGTTAGVSSFQFSYFVGVDNTGHEYDAGSPEYANALRNVDQNVGYIMAAVDDWNAAHIDEPWTVIVTTDHGQVPWPTIRLGSDMRAHGFQTPWETTTFVIANGADFTPGAINNTYLNIDVTPTVAELFGLAPEPYSAGKPLMDRAANDYAPLDPGLDALKLALTDAIDMYGYPDIATNVALVIRTIAATIPYVVYTLFDGLTADMPQPFKLPIQFVGAVLYQLTNIPAQLIARLTGVTGNQIIPPDLWPYTTVPGTQPEAPAVPIPAAIAV
ncbi:alkaline phosphatase family protein [Mycobacterium sp. CVI_P3]|uniref:Alkaline phosphatase family protein n=1 Tax=Mycobacterium pinniadriaticum TaxID=2994102 RepID=A0ABT3SI58_9MYCO|nr:alkaline phosphatase family protein [Mycobacterium pinniadriaticum]MCX2932728.1 alkaline phosphatase family protein [Mycobacterium pinniadriaticum]MCX2939212.1 alkaline phosphatase family protein [Mycobacterium pinniadriaticum]